MLATKSYQEALSDSVALPNFLIVGAAKAGTTSLYEYLRQHPGVFMPPPKSKEPMYFVANGGGIKNIENYLALFREAPKNNVIGEASTGYLYSKESPQWIKSVLGDIKIIIMLRNPANRAFSLYEYMVREGWEDAATFEEALVRESDRIQKQYVPQNVLAPYPPDYFYFNSGLYYQQVARYIETFGEDRVKIYFFENFTKDPGGVCRDIFDFLHVDTSFVPVIKIFNEGRMPWSIALQYWIQSVAMGRKTCQALRVLPRQYRGRVLKTAKKLNIRAGKKAEIPSNVYSDLIQRYRPDIAKLENLLGVDLSMWYRNN